MDARVRERAATRPGLVLDRCRSRACTGRQRSASLGGVRRRLPVRAMQAMERRGASADPERVRRDASRPTRISQHAEGGALERNADGAHGHVRITAGKILGDVREDLRDADELEGSSGRQTLSRFARDRRWCGRADAEASVRKAHVHRKSFTRTSSGTRPQASIRCRRFSSGSARLSAPRISRPFAPSSTRRSRRNSHVALSWL